MYGLTYLSYVKQGFHDFKAFNAAELEVCYGARMDPESLFFYFYPFVK